MLVWNSLRMSHTANKDPGHHHVGVLSPRDYCCLQWDGNTCWSHISLKLPSCGCNMLPLGLANTITLQQWPCLTHNWHVAVITAITSHDFRGLSIDKQEVTVNADYTHWEDNQYVSYRNYNRSLNHLELFKDQAAQCQSWLCNELGYNLLCMYESSFSNTGNSSVTTLIYGSVHHLLTGNLVAMVA